MKEIDKNNLLELFLKPTKFSAEIFKKIELLKTTNFGGTKHEDLLVEGMEIIRKKSSSTPTTKDTT